MKKKFFEHAKIIYNETWNENVLVIFTNDIVQSHKIHIRPVNELDVPNINTHGLTVPMDVTKGVNYLVTIFFKINDLSEGIVAHESLHAITIILEHKTISYSKETEETYAYTLGWLTNKVYELHKVALKKRK